MNNTCDPRRAHTEPSSTPITPAPITTILFGTSFRDKAPVEETTVSSSTCLQENLIHVQELMSIKQAVMSEF